MKLAALFVRKLKQDAIVRLLAPSGMEILPARDIGDLVQILKRPDVSGALVEDDPTQLVDWLAVLQIRLGGEQQVIVIGDERGLGMEEALRYGATDYVDHTVPHEQLRTRLSARLLCSRQAQAAQRLHVGPYALCPVQRAVYFLGQETNLTSREFSLAWVLFSNAGRVVSAPSLSARVWGRSQDVCKRTLEQHIYKLRRKLGIDAMRMPLRIQAIYGIGYRLDVMEGDLALRGPATAFEATLPAALDGPFLHAS